VSALLNRSYMKHRQLKCWRCSEVWPYTTGLP
jgi:hypothetical protein